MRDITTFLKEIKKAEKNNIYVTGFNTIRIAILGSYSTQYIVKGLRYLLFENYGVKAEIFEAEYNSIISTLMDKTSDYYKFNPQITVLLPNNDILDLEVFNKIWSTIPGYILQSNFICPNISALGNLESNVDYSVTYRIREANLKFIKHKPANVTFLDIEGLASNIGRDNWFDYSAYFSTKQGFNLLFLENVCGLIVRQIGVLLGKTKKCLVLDLDNTIWGGIIGDDGYDGINLDPNNAIGEAYLFFQKFILELKNRGVLLAICSKNEEFIAKEAFEKNENMILKLSDISCFIANWEDKATNLRRIANYLNIGLDSLVFFDDNPAERELIKMELPEVKVINVPEDPAYYAKILSDSGSFDWLQITKEDLNRASSYQANKQREELLKTSADYETYLKALQMEYKIGYLDEQRVPRFVQLINKSNQFNLRTQRYTEAQIDEMLRESKYKLIYAELKDKFSNYGLISCVIIKDNYIDTWVMSCRVLKRHVENKLFEFILNNTTGNIYGGYIPTDKNMIVKDFYISLGFKKVKEGEFVYERI